MVHSNSGLLFKFTKKTSKNISLERQYFIETKSGNIKHLTSKYVRRGTFTEINDNLKIDATELKRDVSISLNDGKLRVNKMDK